MDLIKVEILESEVVIKDIVERFSEKCDRTVFTNSLEIVKQRNTEHATGTESASAPNALNSSAETAIENKVKIMSFVTQKADGMLYSTVGEAARHANIEVPDAVYERCLNDKTRRELQKKLGISVSDDIVLQTLLEKDKTFGYVNVMLREDSRDIVPFLLHVLCALRSLKPIETRPLLYVDDTDTEITPEKFCTINTFKIIKKSLNDLNVDRTYTIEISGDYIAYSLENFGERYKDCTTINFKRIHYTPFSFSFFKDLLLEPGTQFSYIDERKDKYGKKCYRYETVNSRPFLMNLTDSFREAHTEMSNLPPQITYESSLSALTDEEKEEIKYETFDDSLKKLNILNLEMIKGMGVYKAETGKLKGSSLILEDILSVFLYTYGIETNKYNLNIAMNKAFGDDLQGHKDVLGFAAHLLTGLRKLPLLKDSVLYKMMNGTPSFKKGKLMPWRGFILATKSKSEAEKSLKEASMNGYVLEIHGNYRAHEIEEYSYFKNREKKECTNKFSILAYNRM